MTQLSFCHCSIYYRQQHLTCNFILQGASHLRKSVDIQTTVKKHVGIIPNLRQAHIFSWCYMISCLFESWENYSNRENEIRTQTGQTLKHRGTNDWHHKWGHILHWFFFRCTNIWWHEWIAIQGQLICQIQNEIPEPELRSLPPTLVAFKEHVYSVNLQTAISKASLDVDPSTF